MSDADYIGAAWEIPAPFHTGHTLTVRGRDAVEKLWIDCSCGASFLMGDAHIERAIAGWTPYGDADAHSRPRPVKPLRVKR